MARNTKVLKFRAQAKKFTFKFQAPKRVEGQKGKYYPADDVVFKKGEKPVRNPTKIRSNITPGTVVILLSGRFLGKRVVVLKVLASGLLLVTGPYNVNGVPLRRVNQRYVIATSTKVSLDGVDASKVDDSFFSREKDGEGKINAAKKAAQEAIDNKLKANVEKVELLKGFLSARFRLRKADKPHLMKF